MNLTLKIREAGEVTVIDVAGPLRIGEGVGALCEALRNLVARYQKKLLLNLCDVSYIDRAGPGEDDEARATTVSRRPRARTPITKGM